MRLPSSPQPDILGPSYDMITLDMGTDYEGHVTATLVRRRAGDSRRAVLYIHGYNDYFFQKHLADFYIAKGISFYALDLRKYGRSLMAHQTPYLCLSLDEYFPDVDAAIRVVQGDGHDSLILTGHSTGGLIACIWADAHPDFQGLSGMVLNSPYLSSGIPVPVQWILDPVLNAVVQRRPQAAFPWRLSPRYARSLHQDFMGEWEFNTDWKSVEGTNPRVAWLASIHEAQRRVRGGLNIQAPILVLCSTESRNSRNGRKRGALDDELLTGDSVLDVRTMARLSTQLGRRVTLVRLPGAMHDVFLSGRLVREQAFGEIGRWLCMSSG